MIVLDKYELHLIREALKDKVEKLEALASVQQNKNAKHLYELCKHDYEELLKELMKGELK